MAEFLVNILQHLTVLLFMSLHCITVKNITISLVWSSVHLVKNTAHFSQLYSRVIRGRVYISIQKSIKSAISPPLICVCVPYCL